MTIDTLLTGAVVLVALIFVVRRFMKPSCSCCANKGGGCRESDGSCPPRPRMTRKIRRGRIKKWHEYYCERWQRTRPAPLPR